MKLDVDSSKFIVLGIVFLRSTCLAAERPFYPHYARNPAPTNFFSNQTAFIDDDQTQMCHLSVRCPSLTNFSPLDRDTRNSRFSIETLLSMNGPAGPVGAQGPRGTTGPRGAVGPQGETGKSKEFVPIVAFIAYLEKMLMVEANRTETIVFESAPFNEGKAYDTKTGIFTASYSGVYKFSVTIMAQMDSIATARIVQNGEKILGMIRCDCRRRFSHVRASIYVQLKVKDRISVEAVPGNNDVGPTQPQNNIYGYTYTHFDGVLLFLSGVRV